MGMLNIGERAKGRGGAEEEQGAVLYETQESSRCTQHALVNIAGQMEDTRGSVTKAIFDEVARRYTTRSAGGESTWEGHQVDAIYRENKKTGAPDYFGVGIIPKVMQEAENRMKQKSARVGGEQGVWGLTELRGEDAGEMRRIILRGALQNRRTAGLLLHYPAQDHHVALAAVRSQAESGSTFTLLDSLPGGSRGGRGRVIGRADETLEWVTNGAITGTETGEMWRDPQLTAVRWTSEGTEEESRTQEAMETGSIAAANRVLTGLGTETRRLLESEEGAGLREKMAGRIAIEYGKWHENTKTRDKHATLSKGTLEEMARQDVEQVKHQQEEVKKMWLGAMKGRERQAGPRHTGEEGTAQPAAAQVCVMA